MILGFEYLMGRYTGCRMVDLILKVLDSYGIEKDRVLTITSNNALNNGILIKCMNNILNLLGNEFY